MSTMRHKGHAPAECLRVLLWGGWFGSRNVGDTAILWAVADMIRSQNRAVDVRIYAFSIDVEYTNRQGVAAIDAPIRSDVIRPWTWFRIVRAFKDCDVIVVTGGTPFLDAIHVTRVIYLSLAKLFRKPTYIFSVGAKPIKSGILKRIYRYLLKDIRFASVRDSRSLELMEDFGVSASLVPDSAFWMGHIYERSHGQISSPSSNLAADRQLNVGFAPRLLNTNHRELYLETQFSHDRINRIKEEIADFIVEWGSVSKLRIIPMHFHGPDSDVQMFDQILDCLKKRSASHTQIASVGLNDNLDHAIVLGHEMRENGELAPDTYLQAIEGLDILVGMRLHSLILAMSIGVPVVALSYEEKINQIFADLDLSSLVFDLRSRDLTELGHFLSRFRDIEVIKDVRERVGHKREEILARLSVEASNLRF